MNALTRSFPGMRTLLAPEATVEQVRCVAVRCAFRACVVIARPLVWRGLSPLCLFCRRVAWL